MAERCRAWAIESRVKRPHCVFPAQNCWALQGVYANPELRKLTSPFVRDFELRPYVYRTRARARQAMKAQQNWFIEYRVVRVEVITNYSHETK